MSETENLNQIDFDNYRKPWELEDYWLLKKQFLETYQDKFDLDRLLSLAQTFINVEIMGNTYSEDLMALVKNLTKDWHSLEEFKANKTLMIEQKKKSLKSENFTRANKMFKADNSDKGNRNYNNSNRNSNNNNRNYSGNSYGGNNYQSNYESTNSRAQFSTNERYNQYNSGQNSYNHQRQNNSPHRSQYRGYSSEGQRGQQNNHNDQSQNSNANVNSYYSRRSQNAGQYSSASSSNARYDHNSTNQGFNNSQNFKSNNYNARGKDRKNY